MGGAGGYDMAVNLGIEMFASFDQYAWPVAYVALAAMAPARGCVATSRQRVSSTHGHDDR